MGAIEASDSVSDGASGGVWFISHAGADRAWAEWIAWQLLEAGHEIELDCWDWGTGDNFILKMNAALERGRMLALFSPAYFEPERFTTLEWTAMLARQQKITPVRIAKIAPPAILSPFSPTDLFGLDDHDARQALLGAVTGTTGRPEQAPQLPPGMRARIGGTGPRLPGSLPRVRNLAARNAAFTGRDGMLVHLREALASGERVAVQALHGRGGVGKTQLALEYAYRFAGEYEIIWWIAAEDPALIPDQLAALASRIGTAPSDTPPATAVELLLAELGERARWLLVFDNAERPDALADFLPGGPGHVLITSRNPRWNSYAVPIDITTLSRSESRALLRAHGAVLTDEDADDLAATLEDLPLALAQTAALLTGGLSPEDLKEELAANAAAVLAEGRPAGYPVSLAAQVRLSAGRLGAEHPGAMVLLSALALLAPEPFPVTACASRLPGEASAPLARALRSRLATGPVLQAIGRHSLARVQDGNVQLHRLTQGILARQLTGQEHEHALADAEALLVAAGPRGRDESQSWPAWQTLLPHALAIDPTRLTTSEGRTVVSQACWYLMERGQAKTVRERLQQLYETCLQQLGSDHDDTLWAAHHLARAFDDTQDRERALALDEDTHARRRRLYGDDHHDTLVSALNLAVRLRNLGRHEDALALNEKTMQARHRVSGAEHAETLRAAFNFAGDLMHAGRAEEAMALTEETLEVQRRALGPDHPDTLLVASHLSVWLAEAGRVEEAVALGEHTIEVQRRVLGPDHPDTLRTASNLANYLMAMGRVEEAVALGEDTLEAQRRLLGADQPNMLRTAFLLARRLREVGRVEEAVRLAEETLESRRRLLGPDAGDTLSVAFHLTDWLAEAGRVEEAVALAEETLEALRRAWGEEAPETLLVAYYLSVLLARVGRVGEAAELGGETLAVQRRVVGADHPDTLRTAYNQSALLARVGRVGESVALREETFERQRRVLGEEHPDTLRTASSLALWLARMGRVEEAVVLGEDTLAQQRRVLGEEHPDGLLSVRALQWIKGRQDKDPEVPASGE